MNRPGWKIGAALLIGAMAAVPFLGFDNLPRQTRAAIDAERASLVSATTQVQRAKDEVTRELKSEADLFRTVSASAQWPVTIDGAATVLQSARRDMQRLDALEKANRRGDRNDAERLLADERRLRMSAVHDAAGAQNEASHWVDLKQHLPADVQQMGRNYEAIHGFDFTPATATVEKAGTDWPEKRADLETRLAGLRSVQSRGEQVWQASADLRRMAAANDYAHLNFGALGGDADALHTAAADLPQKTAGLTALTGQLYNSWDKILVDMEERGHGKSKTYDQEIRTVTTRVPDAASKGGATSSAEAWVDVPKNNYDAMRNDLGMAIEHKASGKYDSESEHVAQPAGFAYMAPQGQSNQYGYWDHRDGRDFWVFYGQYALLRDLLFHGGYRPVDYYEYRQYRTYRDTGRTYYGGDAVGSLPRYGTQGTATADHYSNSTFAKGGGFRNSQYASKSGNYRDSHFSTPNAGNPNADHSPKRFGSGSSGSPAPRYSPRPSAPRPSFHPPSSGRRFGRR
ncbi:MAG TPA: hypothetical protein VHW24_13975 [Bryobacteraceae bacterium]|nr:hypothetical protein [Bryobacteraceae bacterium]